jgi:hypothetical protein
MKLPRITVQWEEIHPESHVLVTIRDRKGKLRALESKVKGTVQHALYYLLGWKIEVDKIVYFRKEGVFGTSFLKRPYTLKRIKEETQ